MFEKCSRYRGVGAERSLRGLETVSRAVSRAVGIGEREENPRRFCTTLYVRCCSAVHTAVHTGVLVATTYSCSTATVWSYASASCLSAVCVRDRRTYNSTDRRMTVMTLMNHSVPWLVCSNPFIQEVSGRALQRIPTTVVRQYVSYDRKSD